MIDDCKSFEVMFFRYSEKTTGKSMITPCIQCDTDVSVIYAIISTPNLLIQGYTDGSSLLNVHM